MFTYGVGEGLSLSLSGAVSDFTWQHTYSLSHIKNGEQQTRGTRCACFRMHLAKLPCVMGYVIRDSKQAGKRKRNVTVASRALLHKQRNAPETLTNCSNLNEHFQFLFALITHFA